MFAIVRTGGKQYRVSAGDRIRVERLEAEAGQQIHLSEVLMYGEAGSTVIGTPVVEKAAVAATVIEQMRDKKIIVFKKKRRQNYRRKKGHRQHLTVLHIDEILLDASKAAPKAKAAAKPAAEAEEKPKAAAKKPAAKAKAE
ncbi:MAG: 50S ribosomal protein L21 [Holosporales bacterium]